MSQSPGSTVMPSVEIASAPAGTASDPTCPTARIRSPSMITTLFWIGLLPLPSTSVPPTSALTPRVCPRGATANDSAKSSTSAQLRFPTSSLLQPRLGGPESRPTSVLWVPRGTPRVDGGTRSSLRRRCGPDDRRRHVALREAREHLVAHRQLIQRRRDRNRRRFHVVLDDPFVGVEVRVMRGGVGFDG